MRHAYTFLVTLVLATVGLPFLHGQDTESGAPADGVQVLAQGPVHEAYAAPQQTRPEATPAVPKPPPDPIQEVPPDQKPEGDNVQWIPGYWAWDAPSEDYVWVSGFWRNVPPGQQWVPGHWDQEDDGWRWVPGFWTSVETQQIDYLPEPPASIDSGPSVPAPNDDSVYVPGCWVWNETQYDWRPGTWIDYHPDWCYVPAHYVWSPAGYVFCEGYWDYPLADRGLLFAPVRFTRRLWERQDYAYTPSYVVQPDFLLSALFTRAGYPDYAFGDYFADNYRRLGFRPWIEHHYGRFAHDPSYSYYARAFGEKGWERGIQRLYEGRYSGAVPRPPHDLVRQNERVRNLTVNKTRDTAVARSLNFTHIQNAAPLVPLAQAKNVRVTGLGGLTSRNGKAPAGHPLRVETLSREQRVEHQQTATAFREAARRRNAGEARPLTPGRRPTTPQGPKLNLPKPPTIGVAPQHRPVPPALGRPVEGRPTGHTPPAGRPGTPVHTPTPTPTPHRPEVHTPGPTPQRPEVHTPTPQRPEVHTPGPMPQRPAVHTPTPTPQRPEVHTPQPHANPTPPVTHAQQPRIYTPPHQQPVFHPQPSHVPPPPRPQPHPQPAPRPQPHAAPQPHGPSHGH